MAVEAPAASEEQAFIDGWVEAMAADPRHRDVLLARCAYHLARMSRLADAFEQTLPQLQALAGNGMVRKLLGGKRG